MRDELPPSTSRPPAEDLQRLSEGLQDLMVSLREEGARAAAPGDEPPQVARMQQRLEDMQREHRQLAERLHAVEQQAFQLLNGSVALSRLHGLLRREEVLEALQDIVVSLVGCEQLAIFETGAEAGADGAPLRPSRASGVDAAALERAAQGPVAQVLRSGRVWVREDERGAPPSEHAPTACIPLRVGSLTVGALALFALLPHKERLDEVDRALFAQLATHGATALYCARLHEQRAPSAARAP